MSTTPTLDEFRAEVTAFLDRHAERKPGAQASAWGEGDDDVAMFEEVEPEMERGRLAEAKSWRATRYDAGLGYITGPAEYGGRELPPSYGQLYSSLEARYAVPDPTSRPATSPPCTGPTSSRASSSASPVPGPTWPACRRGPNATATSGSSPARRCGHRAPTTATSARSSAAPTPTSPSTRGSPASSSTCTPRASTCARCAR